VIDKKKLTHDFAIQSMKCTIIQPHDIHFQELSSATGWVIPKDCHSILVD